MKATDGKPSEWLNGVPTITNADTLGIRPDLVERPVTSWADLLAPEFKGKTALQEQPTVGSMDVALALEARGDIKYGDKGNMTKAEIDKTDRRADRVEESGQFRSFWSSFDQSVNLMASGEVVIQSMWSPAVVRGALSRHPLHLSAVEGRLPRLGLHAWRDEACQRPEAGLLL